MAFLAELWLPILLSAVFVFVLSSIIHMALPNHRGDYRKLSDEEGLLDAMRTQGVTPGDYMFPCAGSMKDAATPEMIEKFKRGPVGILTIMPSGAPAIGKNLAQWFGYSVLVGVFAGYVAWHGAGPGAGYAAVFRLSGAVAMAAYALGSMPASIWKGTPWRTTAKFIGNGIAYGLVTGGTFGWLWP